MNTLMIAAILIVLIIALAIVLFMMKGGKLGANKSINNKAPNLSNRVLPSNQQAAPQAFGSDRNAPAPAPAPRNSVMIAQSFIDQQRYSEAEEELKKGMRMQPNDNAIPLKLLNLYAITNNSEGFHNVFAVILDKGNTAAIQEAEQLKSILAAEKAAQQPSNIAEPSSVEPSLVAQPVSENIQGNKSIEDNDIGLDFDAFLNESNPESIAQPKPTDTLENNITTDALSDNAPTDELLFEDSLASPDVASDNFDNSLSLDSAVNTELETIQEPVNELSFDKELSLDSSTANIEEQPVQELSLDSSFDELSNEFSIDTASGSGIDNVTEEVNDFTTTDLTQELSVDNISGLEDFNLEQNTSNTDPSADLSLDSAFDDFNVEVSEPPATPKATTTDNQGLASKVMAGVGATTAAVAAGSALVNNNDSNDADAISNTEMDFADFNIDPAFEEVGSTGANTEANSTKEAMVESLINEAPVSSNDFSLDTPSNTSLDTSLETSLDTDTALSSELSMQIPDPVTDEGDLQISDFSLEQTTEQQQQSEKPVTEPVTDIVADTSELDAVVTPSAPVAPVNLSSEFDFINEIDQNQITLDLATQYLDLGEYDSAKRLINEVLANGNDAQKQQATSLLAYAG